MFTFLKKPRTKQKIPIELLKQQRHDYSYTFRTKNPSEQRLFGAMTLWTNNPSDQQPFGPTTLRTNNPSDQQPFGPTITSHSNRSFYFSQEFSNPLSHIVNWGNYELARERHEKDYFRKS